MKSFSLKISGMTCASCAAKIETATSKIDGVVSASVNYAMESAKFDVARADLVPVVESQIEKLGFQVVGSGKAESNVAKENSLLLFLISIILSLLIFSFEMGPLKKTVSLSSNWLIQLCLAFPIWLFVGRKFLRAVVRYLTTLDSNMNTLIGIGTSSAFLYSSFITLFNQSSIEFGLSQKVYFEAVGFIISFVYLGQYFEDKAKKKTKEAVNSLFALSAKKAIMVGEDSQTSEVSVDELLPGDILRILPGAKIPVDGIIISGTSHVNESMITGEPIPVRKKSTDQVFGGTINDSGHFDYRVTKVGSDTFLSQIISYVENAQLAKPKIQKYADKISGYFTPVVIVVAILTLASWGVASPDSWGDALSNFIAVLVIACPCALGLATPTAVVVATGRATRQGILVSGGDVLETASSVDVVLFDKTGTLTRGRPSIIGSLGLKDQLSLDVASIEQFSDHPLAKAIVKKFGTDELKEPDLFETIKGKGIVAELSGVDYLIGSKRLLTDYGVVIDPALEPDLVGSYVYVAASNKHLATIVIGDEIRSEAQEVVKSLQQAGIETWMVTGDNQENADSVARKLGIDTVRAEVLPLDKSQIVDELTLANKKVVMLGDGINDAPALAKADVSIAMGTGTDVAIDASDVTLVGGDLRKLITFLSISKNGMSTIRQNLFLSMVYNTLLIPIAAGVLVPFGGPMMPPILASVAMGLSSISVVTNSLRIR